MLTYSSQALLLHSCPSLFDREMETFEHFAFKGRATPVKFLSGFCFAARILKEVFVVFPLWNSFFLLIFFNTFKNILHSTRTVPEIRKKSSKKNLNRGIKRTEKLLIQFLQVIILFCFNTINKLVFGVRFHGFFLGGGSRDVGVIVSIEGNCFLLVFEIILLVIL